MPIKVLVVDDSLIFRHAVAEAVAADPEVRVVGSVRNGAKALEFMRDNDVDVVTLDVEMPEMDGLQTLDGLQAMLRESPAASRRKIGVLMLSSHTKAGAKLTIEALEKGAFDFVAKPTEGDEKASLLRLRNDLLPRIRQFMSGEPPKLRMASPVASKPLQSAPAAGRGKGAVEAIAIGISTGGPRALVDMLPTLCQKTSLPVLIVQHMPADFTRSLADSLAPRCSHRVKEGCDGEVVEERVIYIAPGGKHMELSRSTGGRPSIVVSDGAPENGCKPSADVLFRSVAKVYGDAALAVVMTGMGSDGAASLRCLKDAGARILAQDEPTSVVWGMPGSAVATGFVDEITPLMGIPDSISAYCRR
ncbi:MAG: chemotaxis response regulator protein-glutamate methylesterase [Fibrobacterota bacterium]